MISQSYIQNRANDVAVHGETLTVRTLEELRKIFNRIIEDPDYDGTLRFQEFIEKENGLFEQRALAALTVVVANAYVKGLNVVDSDLRSVLESLPDADSPLPNQFFSQGSGELTDEARRRLGNRPRHQTALGVLEANAREQIDQTIRPIFRSQQGMIRNIQSTALRSEFRTAEKATRVTLAQRLMDDFANQGITGVTYSNGARHSIDNYSRMVARSSVNKSANQASLNRSAERGYDLVRINQYAGASDLCSPWQGRVYSLSGDSDKYPFFQEAIFDGETGLFHPNCGHSQSAYIPGVSEPIGELSTDREEQRILQEMGEARGNKFIYDQRQRQRTIERNIRKYKYREASSLDKGERDKAKRFVSKWQGEMRTHLDEHSFLRRRRDSEQI